MGQVHIDSEEISMDTRSVTRRPFLSRLAVRSGRPWPSLLIAGLLVLVLAGPGAFAAAPAETPPEAEAAEPAAELEFIDVLVTRSPLPGTNVLIGYRFERSSEGGSTTHLNELALAGSLAVTDWLQLSATLPYQFLNTRTPPEGWTATDGIGDVAAEFLVAPLQSPALGLAVGGGLGVGFPTGSMSKGTGGQWTLTPFLTAGKLLGPLQLLADVGYQAELRAPADASQPQRRLLYSLALGYPLLAARLFPFLELTGAYTFTGASNLRHQGQLALSPGVRLNPVALFAAGGPPLGEKPWWDGLSFAIGGQFPVTASREFDWALLTSLKYDF
jgi:hypothetical protein